MQHLDQIAWDEIHSRKLATATFQRPYNYSSLKKVGDFPVFWGDFLHAFYDNPSASFFLEPPHPDLDQQYRCLLAGAAEWLSGEFDLVPPSWLGDSSLFLPVPWGPLEEIGLETTPSMLEQSPEPWKKRNVAFRARDLIVL